MGSWIDSTELSVRTTQKTTQTKPLGPAIRSRAFFLNEMKKFFARLILLLSIAMLGYCSYAQKQPSKTYNISAALQMNAVADTIMGEYDIHPYRVVVSDRKFVFVNYNADDISFDIMSKPKVEVDDYMQTTSFYIGHKGNDLSTYKKVEIVRNTKSKVTVIRFYYDTDDTDEFETYIIYLV